MQSHVDLDLDLRIVGLAHHCWWVTHITSRHNGFHCCHKYSSHLDIVVYLANYFEAKYNQFSPIYSNCPLQVTVWTSRNMKNERRFCTFDLDIYLLLSQHLLSWNSIPSLIIWCQEDIILEEKYHFIFPASTTWLGLVVFLPVCPSIRCFCYMSICQIAIANSLGVDHYHLGCSLEIQYQLQWYCKCFENTPRHIPEFLLWQVHRFTFFPRPRGTCSDVGLLPFFLAVISFLFFLILPDTPPPHND